MVKTSTSPLKIWNVSGTLKLEGFTCVDVFYPAVKIMVQVQRRSTLKVRLLTIYFPELTRELLTLFFSRCGLRQMHNN